MCAGLEIDFVDEVNDDNNEAWLFEKGLGNYLLTQQMTGECIPEQPLEGSEQTPDGEIDWALCWASEAADFATESYVNLIPTSQGGTHVNGLRAAATDAVREFCEFRELLPRNIKLSADDIWNQCVYVLSIRIKEPQFSGQTKDKLSGRDVAVFVQTGLKDAISLWLNQHIDQAERIAQIAIDNAQKRLKKAEKGSA